MTTLSLSPLTVVDTPPPDVVTAAAAAGFDATGIRVCPAGDDPAWPMLGDTPMLRETRRRLDDTGLTVLDVEVLRIRPDKDPDEALRILDSAALLGARYVLVNGNDPDEARLTARFAELCAVAERLGLRLGLEFMAFSEVRTVWDAVRILRACDSPAGALVIDALHLERSGTDPAELASIPTALRPYAQLCDAATPPAGRRINHDALISEARTGRLLPGDGNLPLNSLVRALAETEALSVEAPVAALSHLSADERAGRAYRSLHRALEDARTDL
ncbi:sugar phosphate isomerase/epimerase family protein [Streptomyces sp. NPDC002795]|uniref:sugar phosphate isomerase/epimerase family protein n=1 Tax=Streptomyces sp. NPDC002795 TaxID=3364665 RepID=UPI0036868D03